MKSNNSSGFTLIELITSMAIMAVLAAMVIGNVFTSQKKGRDIQRKSDLQTIAKSLELYFNDKGAYPTNTASFQVNGCGPAGVGACSWGVSVFSDTTPNPDLIYLNRMPLDPQAGLYHYQSDGTYYQLYARMENPADRNIPRTGTEPTTNQVYSNTSCNSSGVDCNFGISSTNIGLTTGHALIDDPAY